MSNTALTESTYYTCQQYLSENLYNTNQPAQVDDRLQFSFIDIGSQYNLAISKGNFPLSQIPLTFENIPLKKYQIKLQSGQFEGSAFVRQLNSTLRDYLWSCDNSGIVKQYIYTTTGSIKLQATIDLSDKVNGCKQFLIDDYFNIYILTSDIVGGNPNTVRVINLQSNNILTELQATFISCITMDRINKLYISTEEVTGSEIRVYLNNNSENTVLLTLLSVITYDGNGNLLNSIKTISADNILCCVSHPNKVTLFNTQTFQPYNTFINPAIRNVGVASQVCSSGENSGSFLITDDGKVQDIFLACKNPDADSNLFNMVSNEAYGVLTQNWNPTSKISLTPDYGFGISNTNQIARFPWDTSTCLPTAQTTIINSSESFSSCFLGDNDYNIWVTSTSEKLYGLDLDGLELNNVTLIDNVFSIGSSTILASDYQLNSNKIVAVANNNTLNITSDVIYPKNIVMTQGISYTSPQSSMYSLGFGWNGRGTTTQTSDIIGSNPFIDNVLTIFETFQAPDSNIHYLCSTAIQNKIIITDVKGVFQSEFIIDNTTTCTMFGMTVSGYNCVYMWDGRVLTYDNTGSLIDTLSTGITSTLGNEAFMCCGNVLSDLYIIAISKGKSLNIFTSSTGLSYTHVFTTSGINIGGIQPYLMAGTIYGKDYFDGTSIILVSSGVNSSATNQTTQALTRLIFNASYTSIISATNIVDNKEFAGVYGCITHNYLQECVYVTGGDYNIQNGVFYEFNIPSLSITSTIKIPNYIIGGLVTICCVSHSIGTLWYNWIPITVTGISGDLISVAISRRDPNHLYLLSSNGKVYQGTLIGNTISVFEFTQIQANTTYRSISLSPHQTSYDTILYCYDLHTQNLISSVAYQGKFISSIARNDIQESYAICVSNNKIDFYTNNTFSKTGSSSVQCNSICTKNSEDLSAGKFAIYDFQAVIDSVNAAFLEAYQRLIGAGAKLLSSPFITMDYQSCLMELNYTPDWSIPGNNIHFNDSILRIFKFYSTKVNGYNRLILKPNTISTTQTGKSAYLFNQLRKLLLVSNTLNVIGSFVGERGINYTITDIDIPISSYVNNSEPLDFQPTFLRCYTIATSGPINRISLRVLYQFADMSENELMLAPGDSWTAKIQFVKKM